MNPLDSAIAQHPDIPAFDDGTTQISYGALRATLADSQIGKLTNIAEGDNVAWVPTNDVDSFLTFWVLQERMCVACPISSRFSGRAQEEFVDQIGAKWLPDLLLQQSSPLPKGKDISTALKEESPATLIFSSGSTGPPKAVVHSMAAHVANAVGSAENIPFNAGDRWCWSLPLCHISGLSILVRCAVAGATVVGIENGQRLDGELLNRLRVSHLSLVATQLQRLLADHSFPSPYLRTILLGGSSVDPNLVVDARQKGIDVRTTYGLTEMASQVTTSDSQGAANASGRVLNRRQLKLTAAGEILVRGETLCLGYLRSGNIESVVDEQGWFHTSDLGEFDNDGELVVKGRIDNMFISGGENVHPENIERAMVSLFGLEQVLVVPKSDTEFGARPVAFVQGTLPTDWKDKLSLLLPRYEIPIEVLPWPDKTGGAIKPSRSYFQSLASD
ncbi:MAG: AMP-binding protein [Planctomycetota bacterium]